MFLSTYACNILATLHGLPSLRPRTCSTQSAGALKSSGGLSSTNGEFRHVLIVAREPLILATFANFDWMGTAFANGDLDVLEVVLDQNSVGENLSWVGVLFEELCDWI
jgi:hypothetical protein